MVFQKLRRSVAVTLVMSMVAFSPGGVNTEAWDTCVTVHAQETESGQETTARTYINENINAHNYTYPFHTEVINSYLVPVEQGYMRVQKYNTADILIEYYDNDFNYLSNQTMQPELPIFGGFYAGSDFYYLVFGKENLKELDLNEVIRVVKYNKNWERVSQCSVYGSNTTKPFDFGLVRMTECNGYLFVRTMHEMYTTGDGSNHQANMTLQIRIEDMELTDSAYGIASSSSGYVSHCFNTFILPDDSNHIITLDQGDGEPRGVMIGRYKNVPGDYCLSGGFQPLLTFSYQGYYGQNTTRATLGGFEYSDTSILVAGTSIKEEDDFDTCTTQNLYLSVTDRKELEDDSDNNVSTTTTVRWITNFEDDGKHFHHCATTPRLVKWNNNLFLLIWSETEYDEPTGKLYYEFIDGTGNQVGEIHSEQGEISDCQPIMKDNKVVWYTTDNKELCFYSIDETGTLTKKTVTYPKEIDVFPKSIEECRLAITKIGEIKKSQMDTSYVLIFRGEILEEEKDYSIRGGGCSIRNDVLYSFSKKINGIGSNFYGYKEFEVMPIRKSPKLKSVTANLSTATIKWEQETGCVGYEIYRSVDGKGKKKVAVIPDSSVVSWKDTDIEKGHYYSYSMRVYTIKGTKTIYTNSTDEITVLPGNKKAFSQTKITSIKRTSNKVTIKAKKKKGVSGYEFQFSNTSEFDKIAKKKLSSHNNITMSMKGYGFYVRVRVYRKVKGKKVYGPWSEERFFV